MYHASGKSDATGATRAHSSMVQVSGATAAWRSSTRETRAPTAANATLQNTYPSANHRTAEAKLPGRQRGRRWCRRPRWRRRPQLRASSIWPRPTSADAEHFAGQQIARPDAADEQLHDASALLLRDAVGDGAAIGQDHHQQQDERRRTRSPRGPLGRHRRPRGSARARARVRAASGSALASGRAPRRARRAGPAAGRCVTAAAISGVGLGLPDQPPSLPRSARPPRRRRRARSPAATLG